VLLKKSHKVERIIIFLPLLFLSLFHAINGLEQISEKKLEPKTTRASINMEK
jgi:succinate dehydrogenase hydrophobic anchor subunit